MKRLLPRIEIREGVTIPNWYGVAYWRYDTMMAVCYPIPINFIIGFIRRSFISLMRWRPAWIDDRLFKANSRGVEQGYRKGYQDGIEAGRKKNLAQLERWIQSKALGQINKVENRGTGL